MYFGAKPPVKEKPMTFLDLFDSPYSPANDDKVIKLARELPALPKSIIVVDVSGSMELPNGNYSRLKIAAALAAEIKLRADAALYASSGLDSDQSHMTEQLNYDGFNLWLALRRACYDFGGGGIFLEKAVKHVSHYHVKPDRLYILTDEQNSYSPTFGKEVIVIDVGNLPYEELRDAVN
jgi:hypothetical protein